jgi:hypothetical protein
MKMAQSPQGRSALKSYGVKPPPASVGADFTAADKKKGKFSKAKPKK